MRLYRALRYVLRNRSFKKNITLQDSVLLPLIPRPKWHLFERMQHADSVNNAVLKKNHTELQQQRQRREAFICLVDTSLTEENIVNAITQLRATGGEIYVGAGQCEFAQPLSIPSGISIIGVPDRTQFIFKQPAHSICIQGSATDLITDVLLKNLQIFHEGEHGFFAAVFITHAENISLENIKIIAPRGIGFLLADHVYATAFINCHVSYAGLVGFMLVRDVRETLMKACSAEYCQQSGVFLTDLILPEHIDALDFEAQLYHTDHVIGNFAPFNITDASPYRTDIIDCRFRHNRKMGITTDGVAYLSVKNTVIAHNDCEGITIDNGSWGCSISACHIFDNGWRGHQHAIELGIDFVNEMGLMPDGSSKAKLPGISIDNAAYTRVENNHIECNWGDGIKMVRATYASSISHNLIENNNRGVNDRFHYFGVLIGVAERQHPEQDDFASCHNKVLDNDILGGHFAGIHLMSGVTGNVIKNNHIFGATHAIEDHVMTGNVVQIDVNS